jgi:hypothetical protein
MNGTVIAASVGVWLMLMFDNSELSQSGVQMLHAGSRKLFRYWEALRAERPCPNRSDIDLRQIVEIIPNMVILNWNVGDKTWLYRLAGTEVCNLMDRNLTGEDALGGWDSFERDIVLKSLTIANERKQPCLVRMRFDYIGAPKLALEMVLLPVFDQKSQQVQLFGSVFPLLNGRQFLPAKLVRRELVSARMIWTEHETGDALVDQIGRKAAPMLRVINGGLSAN